MSLNANRGESYNNTYDGWVGFSPYEYTYGGASIHGEDLANVEYAVDFDESGYYVCAAFDISAMNLDIDWKEGHQIGFEISVNDRVVDDERACCIGWADSTDNASVNPSLFGIVTLVK